MWSVRDPSLHFTAVFYSCWQFKFLSEPSLEPHKPHWQQAGRLAALTMIDYQMETVRATARAQAERPTIHTLHTHTHHHTHISIPIPNLIPDPVYNPHLLAHMNLLPLARSPRNKKKNFIIFLLVSLPPPFSPLSTSLFLSNCRSVAPSVGSVFPQVNCNYT